MLSVSLKRKWMTVANMNYLVSLGLVLTIFGQFVSMGLYGYKLVSSSKPTSTVQANVGVAKPVIFNFSLGDISPQLVANGTIDTQKYKSPFLNHQDGMLEMNSSNAKDLLNVLWAFGLANKNEVLEKGPMMDPKYKVANFASTGGWTIGVGNAMNHYSHHQMVMLDSEQQNQVNSVAKTVFRPCCRNSAYFPDCNHGMAMLGLLELMAKNGMTEQQMKTAADQVNALWFPPVQSNSCAV